MEVVGPGGRGRRADDDVAGRYAGRRTILAYDIRTGNLITTWAPTTNGDVLSIVPSPDNTRLYIGGSFTTVNGQTRNRIAEERDITPGRILPDSAIVSDVTGTFQYHSALGSPGSKLAARFIETLPRRGYRFLAPVVVGETNSATFPTTRWKSSSGCRPASMAGRRCRGAR